MLQTLMQLCSSSVVLNIRTSASYLSVCLASKTCIDYIIYVVFIFWGTDKYFNVATEGWTCPLSVVTGNL